MSRSYALDPKSAAQAGANTYINETGKYKGRFTRAEIVTSRQSTEGVEFSFVSDEGLRADYLTLWTYNAKGEALPSLKALNAIMACLRLRALDPASITVTDFNGTRTASGFPALMGKPIGVVLQREEYEKTSRDQNGEPLIGYKFNLLAPFDAQTELMAGEILAKASAPEQLAKMLATLKDKPMQSRTMKPARSPAAAGGVEDLDSDIPF